jgi:hypothetical protein
LIAVVGTDPHDEDGYIAQRSTGAATAAAAAAAAAVAIERDAGRLSCNVAEDNG